MTTRHARRNHDRAVCAFAIATIVVLFLVAALVPIQVVP